MVDRRINLDELFDDLRDNNQDITDFIETMIEIKYIPSMNHKLVAAAFLNKINIIKQKYDNPLDFIITHKLTHKDYIPLVNALSKELGVKYEEAINCQEMLNFNNQDAFLNMISDHQMVFNETNISF